MVEQVVGKVLSRFRVAAVEKLAGGKSNTMLKVSFESPDDPVVVRVYDRDPSAIHRELAILDLVRATVPVPVVLHTEPAGTIIGRPFVILRYVEGITFHQLTTIGDIGAVHAAARSVGQTLAAIGRHTWPATTGRARWTARPHTGNDAADVLTSFGELCASTVLRQRIGERSLNQMREFVRTWSPRLAQELRVPQLVHGDFWQGNILVRRESGRWKVAAILDWESASLGSCLRDIGVFLRYECARDPVLEPHLSRAFLEAGGCLPEGWQQIARLYDLFTVCKRLTVPALADGVVRELYEVIEALAQTQANGEMGKVRLVE
ncbi:MAG: phosphotransferase [Bryobacteraceae bacterium]